MAGGKETPRQKMIGMMYLVLTALLALNVSKEIINAFVKLDNKLAESNAVMVAKSESIMAQLAEKRAGELVHKIPESASKVVPWQKVAAEVRELTFTMDRFIQMDCKNRMLKEVEGRDFVQEDKVRKRFVTEDLMSVENKDDYDVATRLFGGEPGSEGHAFGAEIRKRLHDYRDGLLQKVAAYSFGAKTYSYNPSAVKDTFSFEREIREHAYEKDHEKLRSIYRLLSVPEKLNNFEEEVDWQFGMFDHAPVVAAAALFTSISNDIRSAEAQALELILSRVDVPPFVFNKVEPLAFAPSNYLNSGDSMPVQIMIAAYDSNKVNRIQYAVNDPEMTSMKETSGKVQVLAGAPGQYTISGKVSVEENGQEKWLPWTYSYEVGQPMGVVANEDLTVIYAGYPHTFSATASGYPQDQVSLSIPGLSVSPSGNGKFKVQATPANAGRAYQSTVVVRTEKGTKTMPGPKYVVKKLPTPQLYLGGLSSADTRITKGALVANINAGIRAGYDNSFPLDPAKVRFSVNGFSMTFLTSSGTKITETSPNGQATPKMIQLCRASGTGTIIVIQPNTVSGPSGNLRMGGLTFTIQ